MFLNFCFSWSCSYSCCLYLVVCILPFMMEWHGTGGGHCYHRIVDGPRSKGSQAWPFQHHQTKDEPKLHTNGLIKSQSEKIKSTENRSYNRFESSHFGAHWKLLTQRLQEPSCDPKQKVIEPTLTGKVHEKLGHLETLIRNTMPPSTKNQWEIIPL